jgi:DNA polymerase III sliding clamp (beta) subunit (PCNA family)
VAHATVLTGDFVHALKKTNIFLNKFMQVSFTVSDKHITLSSQSNDYGATTESFHASTEGQEITLNFNQRYLSEVTQHLTDESLKIHCAGIGRPVVIENLHDHTLRYLVMPMNK